MLKTDWKLSTWISLLTTIAIGVIAIYLYYNLKANIKSDGQANLEKKGMYSVAALVLLYVINPIFSRNTKYLQPTDYLAILTGVTTLLWIWFPKEKI
jgi:hypothetical protein